MIEIRPADECELDLVALGEVMLRLDPGESRIRAARRFEVWEGGGEYNVARAASSVFGLRSGVVTALVDNEVGRLVESLVRQGGVDTSLIRWESFDGVGRQARNGLNFTERGFGVRAALGVSDRAGTAVSQLAPGAVDWGDLFGRRGVRWLHTGGIFAGLGERTAAVAEEAMAAARAHGTVVSYDTNYRPSLWADVGGQERAREVNGALARYVDVLIASPHDFTEALSPDPPMAAYCAPPCRRAGCVGEDSTGHRPAFAPPPCHHTRLATLATAPTGGSGLDDDFAGWAKALAEGLPVLQVVATTLRAVHSASVNDWQGVAWSPGTVVQASAARERLDILDRVGGGDGFVAGLVYGLLAGEELGSSVELGAAHGALAMTTPGDGSMATLAEVRSLALGGDARSRR